MFMKLTTGAAALAAAALFTPISAAPIAPQTLAAEGALVQQAHWAGKRHCRRAVRRCWRHHPSGRGVARAARCERLARSRHCTRHRGPGSLQW